MSLRFEYSIPVTLEELDFVKTVEAGQSFRWDQLSPEEWIGADGGHCYRVQHSPSMLHVRSNAPEREFRALFRMEETLAEIGSSIEEICPELAQTLASARGLRLMRHSCKREVLFSFLCSSMNNIPRIKKMVRHLAKLSALDSDEESDSGVSGKPTPLSGSESTPGYGDFPSLETLAAISEQSLRASGFGYRAQFVTTAARQILDRGGESWMESLNDKAYPEAHMDLSRLSGIGPKVADCILLLGYGMGEAFPIDTHVLQAASRLHNSNWNVGTLTKRRYQEVGDFYRSKFGNLAGYAQHLLFFDNRNRSKQ